MNRLTVHIPVVLSASALFIVGWGCPPPKPQPQVPVVTAPEKTGPENVTTLAHNESITLVWPERRTTPISGYLAYLDTVPILRRDGSMSGDLKPFNSIPYPGDLTPDNGTLEFPLHGLRNGVVYYAVVRTQYPDRSLSSPSNQVSAICGPRMATNVGIRYKSESDGLSLVRGITVRADDPANDLFFATKDGTAYLGSPHRISEAGRRVQFAVLKRAYYMQGVRIDNPQTLAWQDRVNVQNEDWLLARTPEHCFGLIRVDSLSGSGERSAVWLTAAYCPLPDRLMFWQDNESGTFEAGEQP